MRELKYPAIYKHFKGEYYATMGESTPINSNEVISLCNEIRVDPLSLIFMSATHTENMNNIRLLRLNGEWKHLEEECSEKLVIYKSLYDGTGSYARPKIMFMSEVDKDVYKDAKQKYRFELVEG